MTTSFAKIEAIAQPTSALEESMDVLTKCSSRISFCFAEISSPKLLSTSRLAGRSPLSI